MNGYVKFAEDNSDVVNGQCSCKASVNKNIVSVFIN